MSSFNEQVLERLTHLENDFQRVEKLDRDVQNIKSLLIELKSTIDCLADKSRSIICDSPTLHSDFNIYSMLVYVLLCMIHYLTSVTNRQRYFCLRIV